MRRKPAPDFVPPMMAESVKAPFDSPDWIFEIKLDGYQAITVFAAARQASPPQRDSTELAEIHLPAGHRLFSSSRPSRRAVVYEGGPIGSRLNQFGRCR